MNQMRGHRPVASRAQARAWRHNGRLARAAAGEGREQGAWPAAPLDRSAFLHGTAPVVATALGEDAAERAPMLVLVIDGTSDIELMAAIAQGGARSRVFAGAWSALIDGDGDVARFHLIELAGDLERCWTLPDWAGAQLMVAQDEHLVALLPRELAGKEDSDMSAAAPASALIVPVAPSEAVAGLLQRRR